MSTAAEDRRKDPAVINELLIAFHEKLGDQWNAEAEADQFIASVQISHPEAFETWISDHINDMVVKFLRELERRQRDAARHLRKQEIVQIRAREYLRQERRREAEARGETWDETEDLDPEAEKIRSIFQLVANTTEDGTTKRIGAWTLDDMHYIAHQYVKVGTGFIRQGQTVETLAETFEARRRELISQAIAAGNTIDAERFSDPTITVADVLTEAEVIKIWVADDDPETAQAAP